MFEQERHKIRLVLMLSDLNFIKNLIKSILDLTQKKKIIWLETRADGVGRGIQQTYRLEKLGLNHRQFPP